MLSLALILNLILIPQIQSKAASYTIGDFSYSYQGDSYYFVAYGTFPEEITSIDDSVLDVVISKAFEFFNISLADVNGSVVSWGVGQLVGGMANLLRNFQIATGRVFDFLFGTGDVYGFEYRYTGKSTTYPDHELYGDAYGFQFKGGLGETIDLVLDSTGHLYGSRVIGNITGSEDVEEFSIYSIRQYEANGGLFWVPDVEVDVSSSLPAPYIEGKSLYFYVRHKRISGSPYASLAYQGWFRVDDFTNTFINAGLQHTSGTNYSPLFMFFSPDHEINITNVSYTGSANLTYNKGSGSYSITSVHGNYSGIVYRCGIGTNVTIDTDVSFNLPYYSSNGTTLNTGYHYQNNFDGMLENSPISGNGDIYLYSVSTSPVPAPIDLPYDEPINLVDIGDDPIEFEPTDDPAPVPGNDIPEPGPEPVPVPPLPPLVSGNDDLWPDMNGVFEVESEIDGFLGGLSNFEFTPLRTLVEGFSSSLIWVSTIMMTLYNGSDFSILFVVLSIFFIAAALLGIYKWWTH